MWLEIKDGGSPLLPPMFRRAACSVLDNWEKDSITASNLIKSAHIWRIKGLFCKTNFLFPYIFLCLILLGWWGFFLEMRRNETMLCPCWSHNFSKIVSYRPYILSFSAHLPVFVNTKKSKETNKITRPLSWSCTSTKMWYFLYSQGETLLLTQLWNMIVFEDFMTWCVVFNTMM